jgi:hypothetical protein
MDSLSSFILLLSVIFGLLNNNVCRLDRTVSNGRVINELIGELAVEYVKEPYCYFPGDTEEKYKKTHITTGLQIRILTQNLPSTKHKCYPHDYNV